MFCPVCATGREDEALDVKRDVREEMAEQRKQLKELLDAGAWLVCERCVCMRREVTGCLP